MGISSEVTAPVIVKSIGPENPENLISIFALLKGSVYEFTSLTFKFA